MLDSLMTLLFLLTLFCFYLGYEKDQGRRRYYLLAGLFMGLGVLTKGPVVYLSLPVFLIFALLQRGLRKFWTGDLLLGFSLSLTIVLLWLIPACILGGEQYTNRILLAQTLGRLSGNGSHIHAKPFSFYFVRFPIEFIPWIVFLPTAFIFAWRQRDIPRRKELLLLSIWFILIFVFFTFSRGKKDNYILPLYPAAAILIGWFWDERIQSQEREKGVIVGLLILTCVGIAGFALMSLGFPWKSYPHLLPYRLSVIVMSSYTLVGFIVSLLSFVDGRKWASFLCIVITFATLHLHLSYWLPQRLNARWSMKRFSEGILNRMEVGDELKMCFFSPAGLLYYTGKTRLEEIRSLDRLREVLRLPQRVFVVVTKGKLDQLKRELKMDVNIIEQERIYWNLVLISNH
jgi:4-amino-4-deoxy-L-arabinose transferase-like glycosyltransferase